MKSIHIRSLGLGALLGAAVVCSIAAAAGRPAWEHKIIVIQHGQGLQSGLERPLDKASLEGWEVAGVGDNAGQPFVLMKRPKQ